jgi:hypothetical protein
MSFNYALKPTVINNIAMAGAGTTASVQSNAFGSQTEYVRLVSAVDFFVDFGASPTATSAKILITADQPEVFKVTPGEKIAGLNATNSAILYVTELSA